MFQVLSQGTGFSFETKVITCNLSTGMLTIGFMNDDNKLLNNPLILSCTWKKKKKFLSLKYIILVMTKMK